MQGAAVENAGGSQCTNMEKNRGIEMGGMGWVDRAVQLGFWAAGQQCPFASCVVGYSSLAIPCAALS